MTSTYIIRHKETKEQWVSSSNKRSWSKPGYAKNAWTQHWKQGWNKGNYYRVNFNDQNDYEIVELKSADTLLLAEAVGLLKAFTKDMDTATELYHVYGRFQEICKWLEENGYTN